MYDLHSESLDRLFRAISLLRTDGECHDFFCDICTVKELQDMAQRLDTAILLDRGMSYQKISEKVGASTATISRVSRCLNYGSGGYKTIIDRMDKTEENKDEV